MMNRRIAVVNAFALLVIAIIVRVTNAAPPSSVVGGQAATSGEFPYQVSLRKYGSHFCGGSIISKKHVLTAAHCVSGITSRPYNDIQVVAGTTSSGWSGQRYSVSNVVIHPGFNTRTVVSPNDIAIITLATELTFDSYTSSIGLPTAPTPSGVKVLLSGWGFRDAKVKVISPTLQKAAMTTLTARECQRYQPGEKLYTEQICAYNVPGIGACQGDSGGPIVTNNQVVGIVSYNIPCALGFPDVFTAVYYYVNWIKTNMQ